VITIPAARPAVRRVSARRRDIAGVRKAEVVKVVEVKAGEVRKVVVVRREAEAKAAEARRVKFRYFGS
jgi:hypothetical protein